MADEIAVDLHGEVVPVPRDAVSRLAAAAELLRAASDAGA